MIQCRCCFRDVANLHVNPKICWDCRDELHKYRGLLGRRFHSAEDLIEIGVMRDRLDENHKRGGYVPSYHPTAPFHLACESCGKGYMTKNALSTRCIKCLRRDNRKGGQNNV